MAITNSEYLLQQILNSTNKSNDNLTALKEVISEGFKNQPGGRRNRNGGAGGNGPGGNGGAGGGNGSGGSGGGSTEGAMSKAFKNMFGEMRNFGGTLAGNSATASNVLGSLGASSRVLTGAFKAIPGPVGAAATAFEAVVDVGLKVYDYMNQQLEMYNRLNSAGVNLANGMLTARKGAATSLMSLNEFNEVLTKNSESLAAMDGQYGNGVQHFSDLLNSVQKLEDINGIYGVSQQQLADLTAKNYKFNKLYSGNTQMRQLNETQSTANFVSSMTYLSKTVGKSVDQLLGKFDEMGQNLDSQIAVGALIDRFDLDPEKAANVQKGMDATLASMGDVGKTLQQMNASYLKVGTLPEDFDSQFNQMLLQRMQELQAAGVDNAKDIRTSISKFIKQNKDMLDVEIKNQYQAGNITQAQWLSQLKNLEAMKNDPQNQPSAIIEQFTKTFNNWLGNTFTKPFNDMYTSVQESAAKYLLDVGNRSDGYISFMTNIWTDVFNGLSTGAKWLLEKSLAFPKMIAETLFGNFDQVEAAFGKAFDSVLQLPISIWNMVMNLLSGESLPKASEMLKKTVSNLFGHIGDIFTSFGNLTFNTDDIKKRINNMYDSIKSKLTGWWDSAKGWFKGEGDDKKPIQSPLENKVNSGAINTNSSTPTSTDDMRKAPVVNGPTYTPPVKVEDSTDNSTDNNSNPAANTNSNDVNEAILKTIQSLLSNAESSVQANNEALNYFRQIAENTAEQRNL